MERRGEHFDEDDLDEPDGGPDEDGDERLEELLEQAVVAVELGVEDEGPGEEHEAEPDAVLDALPQAVDEVENLLPQHEVPLHREHHHADDPAGEEAAAEGDEDHEAPPPQLQAAPELVLERENGERANQSGEDHYEQNPLRQDSTCDLQLLLSCTSFLPLPFLLVVLVLLVFAAVVDAVAVAGEAVVFLELLLGVGNEFLVERERELDEPRLGSGEAQTT